MMYNGSYMMNMKIKKGDWKSMFKPDKAISDSFDSLNNAKAKM
jgi:hypothetical protein